MNLHMVSWVSGSKSMSKQRWANSKAISIFMWMNRPWLKILPIANIKRVAVTNPINTKLPVADTKDTVSFSSGAKVTISLEAGVVGGGTKM